MTAPFRTGDPAVWLDLSDNGLRATQVAVLRVVQIGDRYGVETTLGCDVVDERGEGSRLLPMDAELAQEFQEHGPSFVVRSTEREIEQDLDRSLDWRRFEDDLARDSDRGPDRDL
jgi:hypothetical protein